MIEQTILFPSQEVALSIWETLEKEYPTLKYDGCNGIYLEQEQEEEQQPEDEEELDIYDVSMNVTFETIIGLENTEFCYSRDSYELCCSVNRGLFDFCDYDVLFERLAPHIIALGRKPGSPSFDD